MANLLRFNGRVALVTGAGGGKALSKRVIVLEKSADSSTYWRFVQVWGKNMPFFWPPEVQRSLVSSISVVA